MSEWLNFTLDATDDNTQARAGVVRTPRGDIPTPIFMPVGTAGTVKGLWPQDLADMGAPVCLGNTYHLMNRPGHERVRALGGLHKMMGWDGNILTDSGGFQVFSLATLRKVDDSGVRFRSHIDGRLMEMTPESTVAIQEALGSDIMMPLDICPPHPCTDREMEEALTRTTAWAKRCEAARTRGAIFAIVQGGVDKALRSRHAQELSELPVDGYSIGGLSVGEDVPLMYDITEHTAPLLPVDKPRYLMGVGTPEDLVTCIGLGVDMFDCVMPTRHGRNGMAFTRDGNLVVKHRAHIDSDIPLDKDCGCATCQRFSRAYLCHLFKSKEMLAHQALTTHNVYFYLELVREARAAVLERRYSAFRDDFLARRAAGNIS